MSLVVLGSQSMSTKMFDHTVEIKERWNARDQGELRSTILECKRAF